MNTSQVEALSIQYYNKNLKFDSVGAIWYFLLCGRAPSGSDMREYLEKSNSQITPTDIDIIMKCLSSSIENRYSSCEELLPIVKNAAMG